MIVDPPASIPVTVMVFARFQSPGVNVTFAGTTFASPGWPLVAVIVTFASGLLSSTTV